MVELRLHRDLALSLSLGGSFTLESYLVRHVERFSFPVRFAVVLKNSSAVS